MGCSAYIDTPAAEIKQAVGISLPENSAFLHSMVDETPCLALTAQMAKSKSSSNSASPIYEIRTSPIHGRGLYAARDIAKGERVVEYLGEKVTKAESERRGNAMLESSKKTGDGAVYIFILNKTHDIDGSVPENDARLMNHSCNPSCEASIERGHIWYFAKRRIPQGQELYINYGFDIENWEDHPCKCGAPICVGYIVAQNQWPKLKRRIAQRDQAIADEKRAFASRKKEPSKSRKKSKK
jgi:uncharacterized protein